MEGGIAAVRFIPRQLYSQGIFFQGQPPTTVQAGVPTILKWYGGNGKPVKITLKQGAQDGAGSGTQDVVTIAAGASSPVAGASYTWTAPKDVPNGNDYFYEIYQDMQNSAQSGALVYSGGAPPSASLPASLTSSSQSTTFSSSTISPTTSAGVVVSVVTSVASSAPTSTSPSDSSDGSLAGRIPPFAAGVGAAVAIVILALLGFFFFYRRRRARQRKIAAATNYHDRSGSLDDLVLKGPELSSESEVFEIRSDRDVRELDTTGGLGWLPAGTSRQELPSPIYRHELHTEESLCELEGSLPPTPRTPHTPRLPLGEEQSKRDSTVAEPPHEPDKWASYHSGRRIV